MAQGGRILLAVFLSVVAVVSSSCPGKANYTLTFVALWKLDRHPNTPLPGGAHYTPLVGASHDASYVMWRAGEKASKGVEDVAEIGGTTELVKEINAKIAEGKAWKLIPPSASIGAVGEITDILVQVTAKFPMVSIITMLAPSPDWFIGIDSLDLCYNGKWRESFNVTMSPPWDSGTEDGEAFTTSNAASDPIVNIFQITSDMPGAFNNAGTPVKTLGHWLFKVKDIDLQDQDGPTQDSSAGKASVSFLMFTTSALILALLF